MRAHQIMSRSVVTVSPETPIAEAAKLMLNHHIGGLPVVDAAGRLIGIVSDGDFIRRAEIGTARKRGRWLAFLMRRGQDVSRLLHDHGRTVGDIMTSDPATVKAEATLAEVVQTMENRSVKRLPVTSGDRVVGMITYADFVHTVADLTSGAPNPTADDNTLRSNILAALDQAPCRRCRFNVTVRDGVAHLSGAVRTEKLRQEAVAATQAVAGVKAVSDHIRIYPPPEEEFGGGDFVSLQEEASTEDDQPL
jgi:CBS domain-containing protein